MYSILIIGSISKLQLKIWIHLNLSICKIKVKKVGTRWCKNVKKRQVNHFLCAGYLKPDMHSFLIALNSFKLIKVIQNL